MGVVNRKGISKLKKRSISILLILALLLGIFYFWGSSSNLPFEEYASVYSLAFEDSVFEEDSFRLMTYNMGYLSGMTNNLAVDRDKDLFDKNMKRLNSLLSSLQIDLLCLQEIDFHSKRSFYVDQLDAIAEKSAYPHASRVINWDKKYVPFPYWPFTLQFGEVLSGQAIVSRFPILENERIVLATADNPFYYAAFYLDRLAQVNLLSIGGRDVVVINVHLEAWDARARERQADQLIALYKKYEKDFPTLIVGDFNSTPPGSKNPYMEETTIEKLLAIDGLKMAIGWEEYLQDEEAYFTFNSIEPYIKIDHIFYNSSKIMVKNARVVREAGDVSDHLPVMADVIFIEDAP
jgi:endonuclease/exonuclease/phosphatase family metal-dependent hydrolase